MKKTGLVVLVVASFGVGAYLIGRSKGKKVAYVEGQLEGYAEAAASTYALWEEASHLVEEED